MNCAKILPILLFAFFLALTLNACSKAKSPVEPVIDDALDSSQDTPVSFSADTENRSVLAVYNAVVDPVNKTFTVEPANRSAEYHYPLTQLYPDVLQITGYGWTPNFWADIKLTHPFPGSGIDVFDPRVIAIIPANPGNEMNYPSFDVHANNSVVLEPDGYTKLYDNLGGTIPGNANPFIAYFKEQPYRQWSSVQPLVDTKRWEMDINGFGGSFEFKLVVDISTNYPQPSYPYTDNAPEPVQIQMEIGSGLAVLGGRATITVRFLDWQGHSEIKCKVESADLFDGAVELFYTEPGPNPHEYIFTGTISNNLGATIGEYGILLAAWDINTGNHVFKEGIGNVAGTFYPADITPDNLNFSPQDVFIDGNYAYVAGNRYGLHIFDITNPAQPVWVNRVEISSYARGVYASDGYAYVTGYYGLRIVDIDPPESAYIVNSVSIDSAKSICVSDGYAYVTDDDKGLNIIDIDPPESAYVVKLVTIPSGGSSVSDVCVSNGYAYVASNEDGIFILDIDPPESANIVNSIDGLGITNLDVSDDYAFLMSGLGNLYIVDIESPESAYVVNTVELNGFLKAVFVSDGYAYIAKRSEAALMILDVDPPESAYLVGSVDMPGNYACDVYVSDGYAYVADEYASLITIDIDPPESPQVTNSFGSPFMANDMFISDGYMYVADGPSGMLIYDISIPGSVDFVNSIDTPYRAEDVFVSGGYAYVADYDGGLQIIDIDPPESAFIAGSVEMQSARHLCASGDYAYVAGSGYNLMIVNINPPESAYIVETVHLSGWPKNISISNGYVYVAIHHEEELQIIDVDPPESAYIVNSVDFVGTIYCVCAYNGYAFVTESSSLLSFHGLRIVDIDPPESAHVVHSLTTFSSVKDICISGGFMCMTCGGDLVIVDIDPPELAYKIDVLNIGTSARDICVSGNCVYAFTSYYDDMRVFELW